MQKIINHNGKASTVASSMVMAGLTSMFTTIIATAVITNFIHTEKIAWNHAGYWIMVMLFISSFIGGKYAIYAAQMPKMIISLMSGLLYWGLLLCITAIFFGGNFESVWETAGVILAGCGCSALLGLPNSKNRKKSARAYR